MVRVLSVRNANIVFYNGFERTVQFSIGCRDALVCCIRSRGSSGFSVRSRGVLSYSVSNLRTSNQSSLDCSITGYTVLVQKSPVMPKP